MGWLGAAKDLGEPPAAAGARLASFLKLTHYQISGCNLSGCSLSQLSPTGGVFVVILLSDFGF
jgi:hypothetical protein